MEIEPICKKDGEHLYNSDWQLKRFYRIDTPDHRGCRIELARRPLKLMATVVLPFLLFNLLVPSVCFLPPSSGERIGYSVTLVLSFSVLVMALGDMVPSTANVTFLSKFERLIGDCSGSR